MIPTQEEIYNSIRRESLQEARERNKRVAWFPQFKQWQMLQRVEDEGLYGGAAGGGKSDYLVMEPLNQIHIPHFKGIIFRKTYKELEELIDKSESYYKAACPKARYNSSAHVWRFPSGAKIYFGNMQHPKDRIKYQGRQFDFIGFDELTHFTYDEYDYMHSRNRPSGPGTWVHMRATANPGGIGHGWVKQYFVRAGKPGESVVRRIPVRLPDGTLKTFYMSKVFIPAKVYDNQALLDNDPQYLARLAIMNEQDRKALMDGDWDIFSGQVFMEFRNDPDGYDTGIYTHVIKPFRIPGYWRIYRGFDYGYSKPFSVGWYAVDTDGVIYRINEYYGCQRSADTGLAIPDTGVKLDPVTIARNIREIERTDPNLKGKEITGIADPAIFEESRGESIASLMEREGVFFDKADNTRIAGKMQMHYRLKFDENGYAKFYVFSTCDDFIRTIPSLVYDLNNVEDVDTKQEDHIYDECRYVLMENPITPKPEPRKQLHEFDPLNMFANERYM